MDPDANLKEQLDIARQLLAGATSDDAIERDAERLAELVIALDEWIRRAGFLPAAWTRSRT